MVYKAKLFIRTHVSHNHGQSTIEDIPLGEYDSEEEGPLTILNRIDHPDYGVYFEIDLHNPPFDIEQEPYEFLSLCVRPKGLQTKKQHEEIQWMGMMPDIAFIKEARDKWRLSDDEALKSIADTLDEKLKSIERNIKKHANQ